MTIQTPCVADMSDPMPPRIAPEADASPEDLAYDLFSQIGIVEQLSRNRFTRLLPRGMQMSQYGVLNHLARTGEELSPAALADAFQVTRGAMTNTLQRLGAAGLIEVRPDPEDGRAKLVSLTEAGEAAHAEAQAKFGPELAWAAQVLGDARLAEVLPALRQLSAALDAARDIPAFRASAKR